VQPGYRSRQSAQKTSTTGETAGGCRNDPGIGGNSQPLAGSRWRELQQVSLQWGALRPEIVLGDCPAHVHP